MFDLSKLSTKYRVRYMNDSDADEILNLCLQNDQYYRYCGKQPSKEQILHDLHITPPDTSAEAKYFVGFYDGDVLVAVMDLIDGYPEKGIAWIGFFMMNATYQGRGVGTSIISEVSSYLKAIGMVSIRLGIDKGNPQSTHFWKKNGFEIIREVPRGEWTILVAERKL